MGRLQTNRDFPPLLHGLSSSQAASIQKTVGSKLPTPQCDSSALRWVGQIPRLPHLRAIGHHRPKRSGRKFSLHQSYRGESTGAPTLATWLASRKLLSGHLASLSAAALPFGRRTASTEVSLQSRQPYFSPPMWSCRSIAFPHRLQRLQQL